MSWEEYLVTELKAAAMLGQPVSIFELWERWKKLQGV